jgi:HJR/Mrr/RecB family endonuclease
MGLAMASLLAHSEHVPTAAREALRAASTVGPEDRQELLESAARILHDEAGVECSDAFELVDLAEADCDE